MPTTTNRGYSVPVTGTEVDTWGDVLNANAGLIDNNLGGVASVALTNVNVTLSSTQYKCGTIRLTGTLTGNVIITFPSVSGWWVVDNTTTGNFYVLLTCGAGNNIGVPQGVATDILTDASSVKFRNLPAVGSYWDYAGASVPNWVTACTVPPWLACDASSFSAVTYPLLNTLLGGTTLPDSRGSMRATLNGGTGRITAASSGVDGNTRFARGGEDAVTLNGNQIPSHAHDNIVTDPGHLHHYSKPTGSSSAGGQSGGQITNDSDTDTQTTGITVAGQPFGGGLSHTNMPPAYIGGITMIRAG